MILLPSWLRELVADHGWQYWFGDARGYGDEPALGEPERACP